MNSLRDFWQTSAGKVVLAALSVTAAGLGVLFLYSSYDRITQMRQLELVPHVSISEVEPGEVKLTGRIEQADKVLQAPRSRTPSVFYLYTAQTVRDLSGAPLNKEGSPRLLEAFERRGVDFYLNDGTGRIRIDPHERVNFVVDRDFSEDEGRKRHDEARLEPGSEIFVFGYAVDDEAVDDEAVDDEAVDDEAGRDDDDDLRVVFDQPGAYAPTISERSNYEQRRDAALLSAIALLLGLALISVSLVTALGLLRVHHSSGYLAAVSLVMTVVLLIFGQAITQAEFDARAMLSSPASPAAQVRPLRLDSTAGIAGIALGLLAVLFATRRGINRISTKRIIEDLPTSTVGGAAYGLVELKGVATFEDEGTPGLNSPSWIYFHEIVENTASGGSLKFGHEREESNSFYCRDETGRIFVDSTGAEFVVDWSSRSRRRRLKVIRPQTRVYVLGKAEIDPKTHDRLIVGAGEADIPFIISSLSERQLKYRLARPGFLWLNFGLLAAITASLAGYATFGSFSLSLYFFAAASAVAYLLLVLCILYYNGMVFLRRRVERNWANIDVALKKRFELISKLEEVVGSYLDHEQEVHTLVARARSGHQTNSALDLSSIEETLDLETKILRRIDLAIEAYPDLKGDNIITELMDQLTGIEDEVSLMITGYNDSVERYNTRIRSFPEVFLALPRGLMKLEFFHPFDH